MLLIVVKSSVCICMCMCVCECELVWGLCLFRVKCGRKVANQSVLFSVYFILLLRRMHDIEDVP